MAAKGAKFSARKKNDWAWFVDAWDAKMLEYYEAEWGEVFAGRLRRGLSLGLQNPTSGAHSLWKAIECLG